MYFDYEAAQGLIDAILEAHNEAEHGCHIVIDATPIVDAAVPKPDYEAAWGYARLESNSLALNERGNDLVALDKVDVFALIDRAYGLPEASDES